MPTVNARGSVWVVGNSGSADFPVTPDALRKKSGGGVDDAALAVFSPDGKQILLSTYLGGSGDEMFRTIAFGPDGSIYLVGSTSSPDFPVTANALQAKFSGGRGDIFVVRIVQE